jgi:hypothetical protein
MRIPVLIDLDPKGESPDLTNIVRTISSLTISGCASLSDSIKTGTYMNESIKVKLRTTVRHAGGQFSNTIYPYCVEL